MKFERRVWLSFINGEMILKDLERIKKIKEKLLITLFMIVMLID